MNNMPALKEPFGMSEGLQAWARTSVMLIKQDDLRNSLGYAPRVYV